MHLPKTRGKRCLVSTDIVLSACEMITKVPHVLTSAPASTHTPEVKEAKKIELVMLRRCSGLTIGQLLAIYGGTLNGIGLQIKWVRSRSNPDRKKYDASLTDKLDSVHALVAMMRGPKSKQS